MTSFSIVEMSAGLAVGRLTFPSAERPSKRETAVVESGVAFGRVVASAATLVRDGEGEIMATVSPDLGVQPPKAKHSIAVEAQTLNLFFDIVFSFVLDT